MRKLSSSPNEVKLNNVDVRVSLIQAMIPVVLEAVYEELTQQVEALTGVWYSRLGVGETRKAPSSWVTRGCRSRYPESETFKQTRRFPCRATKPCSSRGISTMDCSCES